MSRQTSADLPLLCTSQPYADQLAKLSSSDAKHITFLSFSPEFDEIVTPSTSARIIATSPDEAFHEAGVYNSQTNKLYISSGRDQETNKFGVTTIDVTDYTVSSTTYEGLNSNNGGCSYASPDNLKSTPPYIVFAEQGTNSTPAGLVQVDPVTKKAVPLLTSFHGRNFSSPNDICQHPETGDLFFTDPYYGYLQGFRPTPDLPPQVYRFSPSTGRVFALADGFSQCNGLEFSPDLKTLYITDTGAVGHDGKDFTRPATIYAFDITESFQLQNRRLFAYPASKHAGIPDGIHTDVKGNVWVAVGGPGGDGNGAQYLQTRLFSVSKWNIHICPQYKSVGIKCTMQP